MIELRMQKPNPKQLLFFKAVAKYIAFGGARGGGKSWAVRWKSTLLALAYAGIKIMIVRRSYPELRQNHIDEMRQMIPREIAKYNDSKKEMRFANGSVILFRYCESEKDMDRYQGLEVDVLFVDEATQLEEKVFQMLRACVRGVNSFPKRIYLTCNPGGRGHGWVKRLFVDRAFKDGEDPEEYAPLIQALATDNTALMEMQPDYLKQLDALPGKLKAAWRYGDWNIFEGQFFEDFVDNPKHYKDRTWTHVIEPFTPPASWKLYRSYDWGYAKPFSCGWWAVDHDGRLYRILEYYGCVKDSPNEGLKLSTAEQFDEIARIEREHPWLAGRTIEGVADPSIWAEDGGVSTADVAARKGVYFQPGDNKRIPGWMQVHYRLRFDEHGIPMMYVFNNCDAFIRTIPLLVYDEHRPEDLDTDGEDHCADEVRYMCMLNPINPPKAPVKPPKPYDPLDLEDLTEERSDYTFYRI